MAQAQQLYVAMSVMTICGLAALPLYYKSVRQREQILAQARYAPTFHPQRSTVHQ
jgi:hypothetical protein